MTRQPGAGAEPAGLSEEELAAEQATELPERLSLSLVGPPVGPLPLTPAAAPVAAEAGKAQAESGAEAALQADAAATGAAPG
jgi:hypothetical protein